MIIPVRRSIIVPVVIGRGNEVLEVLLIESLRYLRFMIDVVLSLRGIMSGMLILTGAS